MTIPGELLEGDAGVTLIFDRMRQVPGFEVVGEKRNVMEASYVNNTRRSNEDLRPRIFDASQSWRLQPQKASLCQHCWWHHCWSEVRAWMTSKWLASRPSRKTRWTQTLSSKLSTWWLLRNEPRKREGQEPPCCLKQNDLPCPNLLASTTYHHWGHHRARKMCWFQVGQATSS